MSIRITLLASAAISLALTAALRAEDTAAPEQTTEVEAPAMPMIDAKGSTVLATVNGDDITLGHLIVAKGQLPEQYKALPNEVLMEGLLEQVVQQTVLGQAMGELSRRAELELESQRRQMIATEKAQEVISTAVTEEAIQAAYETAYSDAEPTTEFNASHILVETEEKANEILALVTNGGDFAELAKEHSTGPSGPNGGDLGWFGPGMMVKPFEDAVLTLTDGQVSKPVQTQFGWHIVKLMKTRMKGAPELDEVRADLVAQIENDAVEKTVQMLLAAAKIDRIDLKTVDPEALSNLSLLDK